MARWVLHRVAAPLGATTPGLGESAGCPWKGSRVALPGMTSSSGWAGARAPPIDTRSGKTQQKPPSDPGARTERERERERERESRCSMAFILRTHVPSIPLALLEVLQGQVGWRGVPPTGEPGSTPDPRHLNASWRIDFPSFFFVLEFTPSLPLSFSSLQRKLSLFIGLLNSSEKL